MRTLEDIHRKIDGLWHKLEEATGVATGYEIAIGVELIEAKSLHGETRGQRKVGQRKSETWAMYVNKTYPFGDRRAREFVRMAEGNATPEERRKYKAASVRKSKKKKKKVDLARSTFNDDTESTDEGDSKLSAENRRVGVMLQITAAYDLVTAARNRLNMKPEDYRKKDLREYAVEAARTASAWNDLARELEERTSNANETKAAKETSRVLAFPFQEQRERKSNGH